MHHLLYQVFFINKHIYIIFVNLCNIFQHFAASAAIMSFELPEPELEEDALVYDFLLVYFSEKRFNFLLCNILKNIQQSLES